MTCQNVTLIIFNEAVLHDLFLISHHESKRLGRAVLQFTESSYRIVVICIACQMESADPFDRRDTAFADNSANMGYRVTASSVKLIIKDKDLRSAFVAAHGLGIIPSGCRIIVFPAAVRTHRKDLHGSPLPVIGKGFQDSKPRSAAGAVYEGMKISFVVPVIKFLKTLIAYGNVR